MTARHAVILVDSTSHALRIEKLLAQHDLACKLVPVPRHLSSDCGVCVRIDQKDIKPARELLVAHGVVFQAIEDSL